MTALNIYVYMHLTDLFDSCKLLSFVRVSMAAGVPTGEAGFTGTLTKTPPPVTPAV